jgi:hypothetical protein
MTEKFWIYDISQLFNSKRIMELWPYRYNTVERQYNAITRLIIYLTILGYFITQSFSMIVSSIIVILVFIILYHVQSKNKEGFNNKEEINVSDFKNIMKDNYTFPTKKNPLMNVMMDDYKYNNKRKPAAPSYNESILRNINSTAQEPELLNQLTDHQKLYRDLGDNLTFEHTMRNFHTMPNTKIPNDQRKFADFCYGNMASCKDGDDVQCSKNMRRLGNAMF